MHARLAIVAGEPGGIGGELCAQLARLPEWAAQCVVYGSRDSIERGAHTLGLRIECVDALTAQLQPGQLRVRDFPAPGLRIGEAQPAHAEGVMAALHQAIDACLAGEHAGLVTGPIHKASVHAAGFDYRGTTEVLSQRCGCPVVMMLARPDLRVALVTTHLPLRAVADAITTDAVLRTCRITHDALRRDFGIPQPRLCVLGLNPHAGENGVLGDEELHVIGPALAQLRAEGMTIAGPLPADSAFLPDKVNAFDAVVAMYHDQGLPVLKSHGLTDAVNITLGLPFPRVAVDHGTALDIAGRGIADPGSFLCAVTHCAELAARRLQPRTP